MLADNPTSGSALVTTKSSWSDGMGSLMRDSMGLVFVSDVKGSLPAQM
jgi:hypothetical protein